MGNKGKVGVRAEWAMACGGFHRRPVGAWRCRLAAINLGTGGVIRPSESNLSGSRRNETPPILPTSILRKIIT